MAQQSDLDRVYMKMAYAAAELSRARRRKVGAILVTPDGGRFEGLNGTPSGFDNNCEDEKYRLGNNNFFEDDAWVKQYCSQQPDGTWLSARGNIVKKELVTKAEVLHAESNAIMKVARSHASSVGSTLYSTLAPCIECAKLIIQAGVIRVVYSEHYPYPGHTGPMRTVGLDLLEKARIKVDKLDISSQNEDNRELTRNDEGYIDPDGDQWRGFRP